MHRVHEGISPGQPTRPLFTSRRRGRSAGALSAFVILALVVGGAAAGWYWVRERGQTTPGAREAAPASSGATSGGQSLAADFPLPSLAESDPVIRRLVGALSAHPELATWLVTDDLVRRFVKTVVALARGSSPSQHLDFAAPEAAFAAERAGGRTRIAAASYARYDLLAETLVSIETAGAAALYRRLHPLFEEAYTELGISEASFDEMVARAVRNVVRAEIPSGPLEVVVHEDRYVFTNARLEARTPAEKHLLRLGPDNARRVQSKVAELATAAGIPLE